MLRIPIVNKTVWNITLDRLHEAPLAYTKRMDLMHEKTISRIYGYCVFHALPTSQVQWKSPLQFKRLIPINHEICRMCYNQDLRINVSEGTLICSHCGFIADDHINSSESCSYTQSFAIMSSHSRNKQQIPRKHSESIYKRCNHFRETLLRLQGKEKLKISETDINRIRDEIKKRNLKEDELTADLLKKILRHLSLQRYYNHVYYIIMTITGYPLVNLEPHHYQHLVSMFIKIQRPFAIHAPTRANMISYIYIVKKLCEILGWVEISECLPHLKSRSKLLQQDEIWRKICLSVGYPFYSSLL